jgi:hypothetical protein
MSKGRLQSFRDALTDRPVYSGKFLPTFYNVEVLMSRGMLLSDMDAALFADEATFRMLLSRLDQDIRGMTLKDGKKYTLDVHGQYKSRSGMPDRIFDTFPCHS